MKEHEIGKIIDLVNDRETVALGVAMMLRLNGDGVVSVIKGIDKSDGLLVKLLSVSFFERREDYDSKRLANFPIDPLWFKSPQKLLEAYCYGTLVFKNPPTCPLGHLDSHLIALIAKVGTITYENMNIPPTTWM